MEYNRWKERSLHKIIYTLADIVKNLTIYYNELGTPYQISDSITNETSSVSLDDNGAETGSESVTDCISSVNFTYTDESSVEYRMPIGVVSAGATIGAGGNHAGVGAIGVNPIILPVFPYDPNPYQTTDTMSHTTEYGYFEDGTIETVTNYLSQTNTYTQDVFGRFSTATDAFGRLSELTYNLNSWLVEEEIEGIGTYTYTLNDIGEVTSVSDPIKGTLSFTFNVRGDVTSAPDVSYTRDIMGRKTYASYTGGSSDSYSYTPEGWLTTLSDYDFTYDSIGNLNTWSDEDSNTASLTYNTTVGSQVLGLPSSITGTGDLSSYSMTYTARNWLYNFIDTNKSKTFVYSWDNDKTLTSLTYPNNTILEQTWDNKILDNVTVEYGENTYLSTSSDFSSEDQKTAYDFTVYAGQGQTFSESYDITFDALKRVSTIEYGSSSKTLTFNYDAGVGKLTSIDDSEEDDSFDYTYDSKERLSSITLPNTQGTISYTYDDTFSGKGRLDEITYPDDRSIDLTWDSRGRVIQLDMDDDGAVTTYYLSYNDLGQVKQLLKSEGGMTVHSWNYVYGLYGAEKAIVKDASNNTILTQDYTTDPQGRILSMTYTPTQNFGGSYTGELYFHYDNYGNTVLLTDGTGTPKVSYEYDLHSGELINEWNVLGIINPYTYAGYRQSPTIPEPWTGGGSLVIGNMDLSIHDSGNQTLIDGANNLATIGLSCIEIIVDDICIDCEQLLDLAYMYFLDREFYKEQKQNFILGLPFTLHANEIKELKEFFGLQDKPLEPGDGGDKTFNSIDDLVEIGIPPKPELKITMYKKMIDFFDNIIKKCNDEFNSRCEFIEEHCKEYLDGLYPYHPCRISREVYY